MTNEQWMRDEDVSKTLEMIKNKGNPYIIFLGSVVNFFLVIIAYGLTLIFRGFVLSQLWEWFITPWSGIPSPNLLICVGILVISVYLTWTIDTIELSEEQKSRKKKGWSIIVERIAHTLLTWGIGYSVYWISTNFPMPWF